MILITILPIVQLDVGTLNQQVLERKRYEDTERQSDEAFGETRKNAVMCLVTLV